MRKGLTVLGIFIAIGVGAYLYVFHKKDIAKVVDEKRREAKGYEKAETPDKAFEFFRKAVRERDFSTAAVYCGTDYAEEVRRVASEADELGKTLDNLKEGLRNKGLGSENTRFVLSLLEPFPPDFEWFVINLDEPNRDPAAERLRKQLLKQTQGQKDPNKAYALLAESGNKEFKEQPTVRGWKLDPLMVRSLAKGMPSPLLVELRHEGEGDQKQWRIHFPVTPALHASADHFKDKAKGFVNALNRIDQDIKNEATTKADVDGRLKTELEQASQ